MLVFRSTLLARSEARAVYTMTPSELVTAFRSSSDLGLSSSPKAWDSLMYRSSLLASEFTTCQTAQILSAFMKFPKYLSPLFLEHIVKTRLESKRLGPASISDLTMIMHALEYLGIFTSDQRQYFWANSVSGYIVDKLKPTMKFEDLARVHVLACRYGDDQLVGKTVDFFLNMKYLPKDPKWATKLLFSYVPNQSGQDQSSIEINNLDHDDDKEPFYDTRNISLNPLNYTWLSRLLDHSISLAPQFNGRDLLCFGNAIARISPETLSHQLGHSNMIPIRNLIQRTIKREVVNLKPAELLPILRMSRRVGLTERTDILDEIRYRIRQLRPSTCVEVLVELETEELKYCGSEIFARLLKYDTNTTLSCDEIIALGEIVASTVNLRIGGCDLMWNLLPNLKRKKIDLIKFISIYSTIDVSGSNDSTIQKIYNFNRVELIDDLPNQDPNTIGGFLLGMTKLGGFDMQLWEKIAGTLPAPSDNIAETYALEQLGNGRTEWPSSVEQFMEKNSGKISKNYSHQIHLPLMNMDKVNLSILPRDIVLIHLPSLADWLAAGQPVGTATLVDQLEEGSDCLAVMGAAGALPAVVTRAQTEYLRRNGVSLSVRLDTITPVSLLEAVSKLDS